jgi:phosphatidylglycerol lysyltransferase
LRIVVEPADLPLVQMTTLATLWAARNGGEQGFSMGRFDPALVTRAVVVLAWDGARLVGFVTLNRGCDHWALDLMRLSDRAPDGTMQSLVSAGILAARAACRWPVCPACPRRCRACCAAG